MSRKEPGGRGLRRATKKDGRFIEGLVRELIKIQTGRKFSLMASLSSRKTSEWPLEGKVLPQGRAHRARGAGGRSGCFLAVVLQSTGPSSSSWPQQAQGFHPTKSQSSWEMEKATEAAVETWAPLAFVPDAQG